MADEEYEHIPWSQLRDDQGAPRARLVTMGAALVIGAAVGVFVGRGFGTTAAEAPATAVTVAPVASDPASPAPAAFAEPVPDPSVPPSGLYTEADLLAVLPEEEARLAAMRAEWFVTDHFTSDGADAGEGAVARGAGEPDEGIAAPAQEPDPGTYVEWARAFRVDGSQPDGYLFDVAYRLLVEDGEGFFVRAPVRAVRVPVQRDAAGLLTIADLPAPTDVPAPGRAPSPERGVEVPADVEAAAARVLSRHGLTGRIISGFPEADGWRVVVDAGGGGVPAFPMVVTVPAS